MDENEEIKKDYESLNEYLKKDNTDSIDSFIKFAKEFSRNSNINNSDIKSTPARVNINREKGTIEIPKSIFSDKTSPEYHRMKLNIFNTIFFYDVLGFHDNIRNNIEINNKRIREWYDYVDKHSTEHDEAKLFLKNLGEEVKTNWHVVMQTAYLKHEMIRKFWWRMGFVGISRRVNHPYPKGIGACS